MFGRRTGVLHPERLEWSVEVTKWVVLVEQQTAHTHTQQMQMQALGLGVGWVFYCVCSQHAIRGLRTHAYART